MPVLRTMTQPEYSAWLAEIIHVVGHNTGAQALYAKLGYQPTNISLFKPIGLAADMFDCLANDRRAKNGGGLP